MEKISDSDEKVTKNKTLSQTTTETNAVSEAVSESIENSTTDIEISTESADEKVMKNITLSQTTVPVTTETNAVSEAVSEYIENSTTDIEISTQSAEKVIKNSVKETENHDLSAKNFESERESIDNLKFEVNDTENNFRSEPKSTTIKYELFSGDQTVSEPESIEFDPIKDRPNESEKMHQKINISRIENISYITPNETKNDAIDKMDNNYVTILIIAGIAMIFLILIATLFCTFFVSGKSVKRENAIEMIDYNNNE